MSEQTRLDTTNDFDLAVMLELFLDESGINRIHQPMPNGNSGVAGHEDNQDATSTANEVRLSVRTC